MTGSADTTTRKRWGFLAGFAVYFVALWFFWYSPVVFPLKIFVVLLHEISHGLVALATGGRIEQIAVSANEGGFCQCPGGSAFLTLSAGYLGSLAWGVLIVWAALGRESWARVMMGLVGAVVLAMSIFFVRNFFGLAFGIAFGVAMVAAAAYLGSRLNRVLLLVLGLTSCLYAILDIKSDVLDRPELPSDARMLAELTGVPTVVWGVLWIGLALVVCWLLLRWSWRRIGESP